MAHEHLDVLVVGAGLSGIGAACHLRRELPRKSVAILEARGAIGGTWDLFRYPGVRSDSDMFTLGYGFRPWTEAEAIADGAAILRYVQETAREYRVDEQVRYHHRVAAASWSTADARWTVEVRVAGPGGDERTTYLTCSFLFICSGYYRYEEGYAPRFDGLDGYRGTVVHPQHWPQELDHAGRRVVVIGSGATAVTLVPAMARTAAHVTMLQRSPSYVLALPNRDVLAAALQRLLPARLAHPAVRWKNVLFSMGLYGLSRRRPQLVKRLLQAGARRQLPAGYDVGTHFSPSYDPWDQRLCVVPDGDLFTAVRTGRASIVTDRIDRFDPDGIVLASGARLDADVVVMATGLALQPMGGIALTVDGAPVTIAERLAYKAMMLSGVPNCAFTVGYTNASWTLKADLVARYVCRLLRRMERRGERICVPEAPDPMPPTAPLLDLTSGYVQRSIDTLPRQGEHAPWRIHQNYPRDVAMLRYGPLVDDGMRFVKAAG